MVAAVGGVGVCHDSVVEMLLDGRFHEMNEGHLDIDDCEIWRL